MAISSFSATASAARLATVQTTSMKLGTSGVVGQAVQVTTSPADLVIDITLDLSKIPAIETVMLIVTDAVKGQQKVYQLVGGVVSNITVRVSLQCPELSLTIAALGGEKDITVPLADLNPALQGLSLQDIVLSTVEGVLVFVVDVAGTALTILTAAGALIGALP